MKIYQHMIAMLIACAIGGWLSLSTASAQPGSVSFQVFYDELSPYGTWVDYQNYGFVWVPDVDQDFSPYSSNGHWVFTDDGWTWASDYQWGWAPFHYGRWTHDDWYGWVWVPHNEWAPAWVTWRRSEGYYGWAPMEPGVSLEFSIGAGYHIADNHWTFVHNRDMNRPDLDRRYFVDRSTNITIINQTTIINNTQTDPRSHAKYFAGPPKDEVQRVTRAPVQRVEMRENNKPGQVLANNRLNIYRPQVQSSTLNDQHPAPAKHGNRNDVKPISERKPGESHRIASPASVPASKPHLTPAVDAPREPTVPTQTPDIRRPANNDRRDVRTPPAQRNVDPRPQNNGNSGNRHQHAAKPVEPVQPNRQDQSHPQLQSQPQPQSQPQSHPQTKRALPPARVSQPLKPPVGNPSNRPGRAQQHVREQVPAKIDHSAQHPSQKNVRVPNPGKQQQPPKQDKRKGDGVESPRP